MFLWLWACTPDTTDVCPTAKTTPVMSCWTCALGTDSRDCDAACKTWTPSDGDYRMAGVCALDDGNRIAQSEKSHGEGTMGEGGLTGSYDATVTVRGSRTSDSVDRQYRVYVPRRYDPETPVPLMFALGGFTVDMYWMAEFTEMNRMADRENFIVVYGHPEWRDFGNYDVFAWYVYNNAFEGDWIDNPDIAYMEAVYNELSTQYNIDKSRVSPLDTLEGLLSPSLLHLNDPISLLDTVHKRDLVQPTTTIFALRNYSKAVPSTAY